MPACMTTVILIVGMWLFVTTKQPLNLFAEAVDFNFPSFDPNTEKIKIYGDALFTNNGIELTKSGFGDIFNWSLGWAVYENPVAIWSRSSQAVASFQTHFQFILHNETKTKLDYRADGISFFMAPQGSRPPINGSGMWLGLFNDTMNGKSSTQKVAIEFDTFQNAKVDDYHDTHANDPDDNHVGIDINNITSATTTSLYSERLKSGKIWDVWIDYDGQQKKIRVFMSHNRSSNSSAPPPQRPKLSYSVNLRDFLPEKVIVGFSASTGLSNQMHNLISWKFSSQSDWSHDNIRFVASGCSVALVAVIVIIGGAIYIFNKKRKISVKELEIPDPNSLTTDTVSERVVAERSPTRTSRVVAERSPSRTPREYRYDL